MFGFQLGQTEDALDEPVDTTELTDVPQDTDFTQDTDPEKVKAAVRIQAGVRGESYKMSQYVYLSV